jgi:hypothetical protein
VVPIWREVHWREGTLLAPREVLLDADQKGLKIITDSDEQPADRWWWYIWCRNDWRVHHIKELACVEEELKAGRSGG